MKEVEQKRVEGDEGYMEQNGKKQKYRETDQMLKGNQKRCWETSY